MKVDFSPMCAPSFLRRMEDKLGRAVEPCDLPALPLISPEDPWWDAWFGAAGVEGANRPRRAGLRLDSQADEGHAAMGGQGFVLLTPAFWRNDIRDGRLIQPFELTATAGFRYWLAIAPEGKFPVRTGPAMLGHAAGSPTCSPNAAGAVTTRPPTVGAAPNGTNGRLWFRHYGTNPDIPAGRNRTSRPAGERGTLVLSFISGTRPEPGIPDDD